MTAAACLLLAGSAVAETQLITTGSPVRFLVPTDGSLGGTWRSPSFNDSSWTPGQNGVGYEVTPGVYSARVIADSQSEWSSSGRQGENHWVNGYYNLTADADATYQQNDFQPFPRSEGPWSPLNFWDGGSWNWNPDFVPWDSIGQSAVHPNGINNGEEHWVIRRWHSTVNEAVTLRFHLRKDNPNGTGVTGKAFKNGVELFSRTIGGGDLTGFEVYLNTTAAVGDVFDFAQTPVGAGADPTDGSDSSVLTATILSGTVAPPLPPVAPVALADSTADWSAAGVQGANNWFYGYYNRTADADATYDPNVDFNNSDPNWTFLGGTWQLGVDGNPGANAPWDTIGQSDWHPNGDNQAQGNHWVIRRWVSEAAGAMYAQVKFAKVNANGNGTTLHVLQNGVEVYAVTLNNTAGVDTSVAFPSVAVGDRIDFALDPKGVDGLFGDGSDSSTFRASIFSGTPPLAAVANSVTDWVTGAQGENGWFYGFYNETADADHSYSTSDFNNSDPNWTFAGAWTLGPADPPWDTIAQTDWHPNGDNNAEVHWVIKRWVSDVTGDFHTKVQFGKANVGGGNGTTLRVLLNGVQLFAHTVAGTDGTGIDTNVNLPGLVVGDLVEFALDPLGTDGGKNDGADGSFLRASILTGLAPVPPRPFLPGIADCFTTDLEAAMKGVNPSVFVRIPFDVTDPSAIETLKLKMKYNDGFVAYLNGTEIAKRNTPTSIAGITVADTIADWSPNPDVTVNDWNYGYYNQSLDADGVYSGNSDFTQFPHDGAGHSPTDFWNGSIWDWFAGNPPWTELGQEGTHPNHPNGNAVDPANPATHHHWTVRRWNANVDANLKCRVRFRKTNPNCGDGVRLAVFHNGTQVYSQTIAFNDSVGRDDTVDLPNVLFGDYIDVLLGPGDGNDFCDGSAFSAVIFEGEPSIPWDGAATAMRTTTQTIAPEVLDLSSFITELRPGANVLAIQGFNANVNDNEFLINAQLLANNVPHAVNDDVAATQDTPTTYPASLLVANDTDADGDPLLLVGITSTYLSAQGGVIRLYGDTVHYTPPTGYSGPDSFGYTISDGNGGTASAVVHLTVAPLNRCPVAADQMYFAQEDASSFYVLAGSDADGDALTYTYTQPAHGTVTGTAPHISYTPAPNYCGPDSFTYTVSDGICAPVTGTVNLSVTCVLECPVPVAKVSPLYAHPSLTNWTVLALCGTNGYAVLHADQSTDPEGSPLTYGWWVDGLPAGLGAWVTNCFTLGAHTIVLQADNGDCDVTDTVTIEVLSGSELTEILLGEVEATALSTRVKRSLNSHLKTTQTALDRCDVPQALASLEAFKNKLLVLIRVDQAALRDQLTRSTQTFINAINAAQALQGAVECADAP